MSPVEVAQVAGEAGFIAGTALTMVAMTLVVSSWGMLPRACFLSSSAASQICTWRLPATPCSASNACSNMGCGPPPRVSPIFGPLANRMGRTVCAAAFLTRLVLDKVLSFATSQGLACGFVLLRVESLTEEGKL